MSELELDKMGTLERIRSNPNNILAIIGVLLIGILCQSSGAESPALQYIANEFSDVPMATITLITTAPSLMMIPASLLFNVIRKKMGVRNLFLLCMVLLVVGGIMPAFANSVAVIIAWRLVFGVGVGFTWPLAQTLIIELYSGQRQNTILGLNSVITGAGGIVWANLGGFLALISWRHSFYSYFVALVIMLIAYIFLPEPSKIQEQFRIKLEGAKEDSEEITGKLTSTGATIFILIIMFLENGVNMTYFTNVSLKVVGEGLGNSANAGFAMSMTTLGATILGVLFGFIMLNKFIRRYAIGIGWLIIGIGLMIFARADSFSMCILGGLLEGVGIGFFFPTMIGVIGNIQGKAKAAMWIGIMNCLCGLAQVAFPYLFNFITQATGHEFGTYPLTIAAATHLVFAVITIIVLAALSAKGKRFEF